MSYYPQLLTLKNKNKMKKLITLFTLAAISFTVAAQSTPSTIPSSTTPAKQTPMKKANDMMIMRQGKMMIFKDGQMSTMEKPMTFKNGNTITPMGMMTMKNGTTRQLVNGERMDLDGNMMGNKPQTTQPNNQQK
jgi:hypothetical protein